MSAPAQPQPATAAAAPPLDWIAQLPRGCYPELKRRVRAAGLLEKQTRYYALKLPLTLALLAPSLLLLLLVRNPLIEALNALYLAAVFAQLGFLGHDIGHNQVAPSGKRTRLLKLLVGPALIGVSSTWWITKHNAHHGHPNREGADPDITLPVVAFSGGRARAMNRAQRLIVRRQHLLLVPMLCFEGIVLRLSGIGFLLARRRRYWLPELALIALHLGVYGWFIVQTLGWGTGALFICVNQMAFGLYMGSVFAPNHKGMPVIEGDGAMDFLLEQVVTSRNVHAGRATDFFYGGLNYQIEHHLFPAMSRNQLRRAQPIVAAFCAEQGIPYCQTGIWQSYRAIFAHMRDVAGAAAT